MKKSAFTLIEVMVVLSILAIIAILAYNFFGSTMKEAKVKQCATMIINKLRIIDDAYQKYYMDNGSGTGNLAYGSTAAFNAAFVDTGILKSFDPTEEACGLPSPWPYSGGYHVWTGSSYGGTAANDVVAVYYGVSQEVAEAMQTMINGGVPSDYDVVAGPDVSGGMQCEYWDDGSVGSGHDYDCVWPIVIE